MNSYVLDGSRMLSREAAHDELARVLQFPEFYGRNLDALWDMISGMEAEVKLIHGEEMLEALGVYGVKLVGTLEDAEQENEDFHFTMEKE